MREGGVGVLMLFLRDWGEGHINPALTAFLKDEILLFRQAICPSVLIALHLRLGCLRPGRGRYSGVCLVTVNNAQSTPNPHIALSRGEKNHPTSSSAVVLPSPSLNSLSFCVAVIYSDAISPSSSFSCSSLGFSNPPHHPPIIF